VPTKQFYTELFLYNTVVLATVHLDSKTRTRAQNGLATGRQTGACMERLKTEDLPASPFTISLESVAFSRLVLSIALEPERPPRATESGGISFR
jgi:hypothetical protein